MENLNLYFLYFFIYSVLGWCAEMLYCRVYDGKWSSRGFLFGPYCPIYGFGSLVVIIFLIPLSDKPILVFLLGMLLTSIIEYIASFLMEKIFNAKWWDYSRYKFNINGRVCLLNSVAFGILALLLTYSVHPVVSDMLEKMPQDIIYMLDSLILVMLTVDFTATLNSFFNFKEKLKTLHELAEKLTDNSNGKISDTIYKELSEFKQTLILKKANTQKRFLEAFPNLEFNTLNVELQEFKQSILNYQEQLKKKKDEKKKIKREKKERKRKNK